MVGIPGFQDALSRKYAIQQQEADARSSLENAQASAIPSSTASENALRAAQAYQTTQQGNQVAPLAQSQIGEAQARGGYYGAEGRLADTTGSVARLGLLNTPDAVARAQAAGFRGQGVFDQPSSGSGNVVTAQQASDIFNQHPVMQALGGNTGASGDTLAPSAFTSTGKFGFSGGDVPEGPEPGSQGFKKGSANVKGKAGGKGLAGLMASLGAGGAGPQMPMPSSPMASPMAGGAPAPGPTTMQPLGMMAGTPQVPGVGSGNVDKVPAMLAPHEAVLTHGAADALGRDKIAKLNAKHPPTPGRGAPSPKMGKPPLRRGMV